MKKLTQVEKVYNILKDGEPHHGIDMLNETGISSIGSMRASISQLRKMGKGSIERDGDYYKLCARESMKDRILAILSDGNHHTRESIEKETGWVGAQTKNAIKTARRSGSTIKTVNGGWVLTSKQHKPTPAPIAPQPPTPSPSVTQAMKAIEQAHNALKVAYATLKKLG